MNKLRKMKNLKLNLIKQKKLRKQKKLKKPCNKKRNLKSIKKLLVFKLKIPILMVKSMFKI